MSETIGLQLQLVSGHVNASKILFVQIHSAFDCHI